MVTVFFVTVHVSTNCMERYEMNSDIFRSQTRKVDMVSISLTGTGNTQMPQNIKFKFSNNKSILLLLRGFAFSPFYLLCLQTKIAHGNPNRDLIVWPIIYCLAKHILSWKSSIKCDYINDLSWGCCISCYLFQPQFSLRSLVGHKCA